MNTRQPSLFDNERMSFQDAIDLSVASLNEYGQRYEHWALAYSGGKDSSATAAFVAWAIKTGKVPAPKSLTVMYADTRLELEPLQITALTFMDELRKDGFDTRIVRPALDDRLFVYMFGRGVCPPKSRFRWCTPQLKIEPMTAALNQRRLETGAKFLMLTGVRMGESAARDQRIAVSCSKDSGECGQGWFQVNPPDAVNDTLAPLLHWRLCFVWDWLSFGEHRYWSLANIADTYGGEEARTGCVGCNLTDKDTALENLIKTSKWSHLKPLMELRPLFRELQLPKHRKRKEFPDRKLNGEYGKNGQRMGPLTMAAREYGLSKVLDIQRRAGVNLIDLEEEGRIRTLIAANTWPNGWTGEEINADKAINSIMVIGGHDLVVQPLLMAE